MVVYEVAFSWLPAGLGGPTPAKAVAQLVQKNTSSVEGGTTVTATFGSAAAAGRLLIAVCGARDNVAITGPSGFSSAINESGTPSQAIFYKVAAGGETGLSCGSSGTNTRIGIHIYEYSGMDSSSPLDTTGSSVGTGTTPDSGTATTTVNNTLLIAGLTTNARTTFSSWTNSFIEQNDFQNGGQNSLRSTYGGADRSVSSTGSYSTAATAGSGAWRGQIAAFKVAPIVLSVDIVDGSGNSVASPSVSMSATSYPFDCVTSTGIFGVSSQKVRIRNTTGSAPWTLTIAATSGNTATWSTGTADYDLNDPSGSPAGCGDGGDGDSLAGQLTVNASGGSLTPGSGCTTTGLTLGSSSAFNQGTTDTITLATASNSANINCYWDLTAAALSQRIPEQQTYGSYSIDMTVTVTAS